MAQVMFGEVSQSRKNNFDIIRLTLAVFVLFSHSFPLLMGDYSAEPMMRLTHNQMAFGSLAVDAFFAISGFLIAQSWIRSKKTSDYFRKRVSRIYPGYIVSVLFTLLVIGPLFSTSGRHYFHELHPRAIAIAMVTCWGPPMPPIFEHLHYPNMVNVSLWTIRYEFWCYLMVALLGITGLLRRPPLVFALFIGVFSLYAMQEFRIMGTGNTLLNPADGLFHGREIPYVGNLDSWPRLLTFFLSGSVFFLYRDRIPRSPHLLAASCLVMALCLWHGLNIAFPICGAYALFYTSFMPSSGGGWITRHGDFSYGTYLYASMVQQTLIFEFGPRLNPWTLTLIALPITGLFAVFSWHFVEKPFLNRKRLAELNPAVAP